MADLRILLRAPDTARWRRWIAWAVTLVFAVLLGRAMAHHEMWRDELQAWLLARDAPGWWGVLHAIRYEGHPGLWHLVLWPFAQFTWNPVGMQVAHALVASASVWTFVRYAPFAWPLRIVMPFGYVLFYEWGVISRNYALSALLLFLFCAAFARRWRAFPWAAAALAAACHTNVHALLLVLVLTPLLMIEYAVAVAGRWRGADRCRGRVVAGFALVLLGIATSVRQVHPPPDTGFATGWNWSWNPEQAAQAQLTVLRAHAPVPDAVEGRFWNTCRPLERLTEKMEGETFADRRAALARRTMAAALLLAAVVLLRRPWFLMHWVGGSLALMVFFYVKYMGSLRHHAFHWLWAVVVLWIALEHRPWLFGRDRLDRILGGLEKGVVYGVLIASTVFQVWGCRVAVRVDREHVFSNSKAAAQWLRTEGLLDGSTVFAGQRGPEVSALVGYAQIPRIYYTGRNEWGSYVIWDNRFERTLQRRELIDKLHELRAESERDGETPELVFISSSPLPARSMPEGMHEAVPFNVPNAVDSVWIYRWP